MNKEEFITSITKIKGIEVNEGDRINVKITEDIDINSIEDVLNSLICYEQENNDVIMNIKGLSTEKLSKIFRFAFSNANIKDPIICLNIINLIKSYNTLNDSFFQNEKICVSSIEDFLDLKLELRDDIKEFIKQFSIYFLSIFKTTGKTTFTASDEIIELPDTFDVLLTSLDLQTICSIFTKSDPFDISECKYLKQNLKYFNSIMTKNDLSLILLSNFFSSRGENK